LDLAGASDLVEDQAHVGHRRASDGRGVGDELERARQVLAGLDARGDRGRGDRGSVAEAERGALHRGERGVHDGLDGLAVVAQSLQLRLCVLDVQGAGDATLERDAADDGSDARDGTGGDLEPGAQTLAESRARGLAGLAPEVIDVAERSLDVLGEPIGGRAYREIR